jgi:RsmE family RNA methyltransferase
MQGEKSILSHTDKDAMLLIGPEGDFTLHEIEAAKAQAFIPVSLGSTRLRTETAGIVGAVMMRSLIFFFCNWFMQGHWI